MDRTREHGDDGTDTGSGLSRRGLLAVGSAGLFGTGFASANGEAQPSIQEVGADDDLQSLVESADPYTWFVIDPRGRYQITPPFAPPEGTFLDAGTSAHTGGSVELVKAGDGDLLAVPHNFSARGINFKGRSDRFDGNGLVDGQWKTANTVLDHCRIVDMAGDGRVHNTAAYCRYYNLRARGNGGYAIRNTTTNYDGFRRSYVELESNDNAKGTLKIESTDRHNRYFFRAYHCGGPGIHVDTGGKGNARYQTIMGSIEGHDGPAIYGESGGATHWTLLTPQLSSNGRDGSQVDASPVGGVVHVDDSNERWDLTSIGGAWSSDTGALTNVVGPNPLRLSVQGTFTTSKQVVEGNVIASIDGLRWNADFNGRDGYRIETHHPGDGYLENYTNNEKWYFGYHNSPPERNPGRGSLYLDTGGSTNNGKPSWRLYDNGWIDI